MYAEDFERIRMDQQIRNLNCGRNCMESLLEWRHGSRYGATVLNDGRFFPRKAESGRNVMHVAYGSLRTSHIAEVEAHRADKTAMGFSPDTYRVQYGLKPITPLPKTALEWENLLYDYGPLLVGGHIGAVEALWKGAGHFVLVIGIVGEKIKYLDPLGTTVGGGLAFFGVKKRDANQQMEMDRTSFTGKITAGIMVSCPPLPGAGWTYVNSSSSGSQPRMMIGGNRP